jgi:hypothetical protein
VRLRVEGCLHSEREPAPSGEIGSCAGHAYFAPAKQKEPAGLGRGFWELGFWGSGFGAWVLGFGALGLGFWGLVLRVWGLGFRNVIFYYFLRPVYAYLRVLVHYSHPDEYL